MMASTVRNYLVLAWLITHNHKDYLLIRPQFPYNKRIIAAIYREPS